MKCTIDVSDVWFDDALRKELIDAYNNIKYDVVGVPTFSTDPKKEKKKIKKLLNAFSMVINWYSTQEQWEQFKENNI